MNNSFLFTVSSNNTGYFTYTHSPLSVLVVSEHAFMLEWHHL